MTLTQKVTRAAAAAKAEEFLHFDHKIVANDEEVEENDKTLDIEKRERGIAKWIGRPRKPLLSNEDMEAEGEEEYVGSTQAST